MRIVGTQIQQILAAYRKTDKADPATPSARADEVQVSERAGVALRARQAFDALPEVREDRVSALRERIRSGDYTPDKTEIARAMIAGNRSIPTDGEDIHA